MLLPLNPDEHALLHKIFDNLLAGYFEKSELTQEESDERELTKRMLVKLFRSIETKSKTLNLYDLIEGDSITVEEPSTFVVEKITPATEDTGITLQFTIAKSK